MIKITYAITVCDELEELVRLINFLQREINPEDQILIQYDSDKVSDEVMGYLGVLTSLHSNYKVVGYPLNGNFAEFKNNLKRYADGQFLFQIDADELIDEYLVQNLREFLDMNKGVDLYFVPRINTVEGITLKHTYNYGWSITKMESEIGEKIMDTDSDEYLLLKHYNLIIDEVDIE